MIGPALSIKSGSGQIKRCVRSSSSCSRLLKKSAFSPAQPLRAWTRFPRASFSPRKHPQRSTLGKRAVLAARDGRVRNATPPVLSSVAALLDGLRDPLSIFYRENARCRFYCARRARPFRFFTFSIGSGANGPSLRASSDYRFTVGALRAQRTVQAASVIFFPPSLRRMPAVGSTAPVERAPSERARSGSKEPTRVSSLVSFHLDPFLSPV
jgi:hypothetical protein